MITGENAICPTTPPFYSATSDNVSTLAARSAFMMKCSVWLLTSRALNAATVTADAVQIRVRRDAERAELVVDAREETSEEPRAAEQRQERAGRAEVAAPEARERERETQRGSCEGGDGRAPPGAEHADQWVG